MRNHLSFLEFVLGPALLMGALSTAALSTAALSTAGCSSPAPTPNTAANPPSHGMHKDFSDARAFSKAFDDPERDAWQRPAEVIELMQVAPGSVVADVGTGTGYFVSRLSRAVGPTGKVLALDVEPKMIEFVTQRAEQEKLSNVEPRLVAADDPGLAPGSVARVLIVDTWHHIDERAHYAAKLLAALAPGGEIWIVDFTPEADIGPPARYRVPAEAAVSELQAAGLQAEIVQGETLPKQYVVRAARP
jgi:predicted methyltransferase